MSILFPAYVFDVNGLLAWLVIGLVAGWLAGSFMKGSGYGLVGDIVVGLIGSLVGGFLFSFFSTGTSSLVGSIVVSFIGACVFIAITRALGGKRAL